MPPRGIRTRNPSKRAAADRAATGTAIYIVVMTYQLGTLFFLSNSSINFRYFYPAQHSRRTYTPIVTQTKELKRLRLHQRRCATVRMCESTELPLALDPGCDSLTNQLYSLSQIPRLLSVIANFMKGGDRWFESRGGGEGYVTVCSSRFLV